LDKETQEKIKLLTSRNVTGMLEDLGAQSVPKEYGKSSRNSNFEIEILRENMLLNEQGGECECEGGCIPNHNQTSETDLKLVESLETSAEAEVIHSRKWKNDSKDVKLIFLTFMTRTDTESNGWNL
jgi:hypothetical protein